MRTIILLSFLLPFVFGADPNVAETSGTRLKGPAGIVDFARVNKCVMGVFGWDYNGYGCYCGIGGSGTPIDGIDECCKFHDECYGQANKDVCFKFQLYVHPYSFSCKDQAATCSPSNSACQMALCKCDVAVTACWKKFPVPSKKLGCNM